MVRACGRGTDGGAWRRRGLPVSFPLACGDRWRPPCSWPCGGAGRGPGGGRALGRAGSRPRNRPPDTSRSGARVAVGLRLVGGEVYEGRFGGAAASPSGFPRALFSRRVAAGLGPVGKGGYGELLVEALSADLCQSFCP